MHTSMHPLQELRKESNYRMFPFQRVKIVKINVRSYKIKVSKLKRQTHLHVLYVPRLMAFLLKNSSYT